MITLYSPIRIHILQSLVHTLDGEGLGVLQDSLNLGIGYGAVWQHMSRLNDLINRFQIRIKSESIGKRERYYRLEYIPKPPDDEAQSTPVESADQLHEEENKRGSNGRERNLIFRRSLRANLEENNSFSGVSDTALIKEFLDGNGEASSEVYRRYHAAVYSLCYRMLGSVDDAEEAAQEVFLRMVLHLGGFDTSRKFGTWLLAIASHYCIDRIRRRKLEVPLGVDWQNIVVDPSSLRPDEIVLRRENERGVLKWLGTLPESYRLIIVLRYWHDLSYQEIADTTNLPFSTVRMRLFRAKRMLAQAYEKDMQGRNTA